jgi:hypothetical protein
VLEKHIEVIRDWPARHTKIGTKEKVPSEIAYGPDGTQWGSLIPPNAARHMWTKLELDRPQTGEAAKILLEQKVFANLLDKKPEDIVADYLEQVKDHLVVNLDNQYGRDLWSTLPITLVVTVPAVWSDAAKDRTLRAVSKAGFNREKFRSYYVLLSQPSQKLPQSIQSRRCAVALKMNCSTLKTASSCAICAAERWI